MKFKTDRPLAAIVGRPNVGKSSIFNRLAGQRIAIVHEEPGVTRDRIVCAVSRHGRIFDLVDTAGLVQPEEVPVNSEKSIETAMRRQVHAALGEATAVIFAVDIQKGIMPADEKTAAMLHKSGIPVFVAANKADQVALDTQAHDFDRLGFPVFPVSALHNRGFDDLILSLLSDCSSPGQNQPAGEDDETEKRQIKVAVVGRPNAGKSSLINRLLKAERMIVSDEPGTTRDSVTAPLSVESGGQTLNFVLTDTAGLRKRKTIRHAVEGFAQLRARESILNADIVALVLDAVQGPTAMDKDIAAEIIAANKAILLVINKWDLISDASRKFYLDALYRELPFLDFAPAVCVSALSGFNTNELNAAIRYVAGQIFKKIPTPALNRAIKTAFDRFQPPHVNGGRIKIFYATQTKIQPVTFLLFCNDPRKLSKSYEKYLKNFLCKTLSLEGLPIVFRFRKRESEKSDRASAPS